MKQVGRYKSLEMGALLLWQGGRLSIRHTNVRFFLMPLFLLVLVGGMGWGEAALPEKVAEDQIKKAIQVYVAERLVKEPEQIDVRLMRPIPLISVADRITVRQGAAGVDNRGLVGRSVFLVGAMPEKGQAYQQWVTADVSVIRKVWVATRLVQNKEILTQDAFSEEMLYQTRLEEQYLEGAESPWGKQASRTILPGEPLTSNRIQKVPVIKRGDSVTLVAEKSGVRITTKGRAKDKGFLGESLAVVPQGSTKVIYGTVLDASTVQILF